MSDYKVSRFYYLAEKYFQTDVGEEEIIKIDMTKEFYEELEKAINGGERLFIEVHGPTRSAKSTVAIAIAMDGIWKPMKESPRYHIIGNFGMKNIARDQPERVKKLMNPNTNHTVIITDEDNELEKTGANASSNSALGKTLSDIHAGRYVHEVMVSPRDALDPNTQIILNTVQGGINKNKGTVFCKLYCRFWEGTIDHTQLIGHVIINVKELIKRWIEEAQELFFWPRPNVEDYKSPDDRKYIEAVKVYKRTKEQLEKIQKEDFYTFYQVKKYEKMDMLTREGIFRPRLLDVSEMILSVYKDLMVLADTGAISKGMVKNFVKLHSRKSKQVNSIVGEELATEEALALLNTLKEIKKLEKKTMKNPETKGKMLPKIMALQQALDLQLDEYKTCKRINEKYNEKQGV